MILINWRVLYYSVSVNWSRFSDSIQAWWEEERRDSLRAQTFPGVWIFHYPILFYIGRFLRDFLAPNRDFQEGPGKDNAQLSFSVTSCSDSLSSTTLLITVSDWTRITSDKGTYSYFIPYVKIGNWCNHLSRTSPFNFQTEHITAVIAITLASEKSL